MKIKPSFLATLVALVFGAAIPLQAATNALPASAAEPLGSGVGRGFKVRTVQAPADAIVANNVVRAIKQRDGTLTDESGSVIPNEAGPGTNPDGSYYVDLISFEADGVPVDVSAADGTVLTTFDVTMFPGIPGSGGHTSNFVAEVTTYLQLKAGTYTFGVNVNADRTDVNDDDSYQVFVGPNSHDFFAAKVGEFERFAPPFNSNSRNENQFSVQAPVDGLYPFRLLYWQTGHGANLQWYTVLPDTDERILVNDPNDPRAIPAYRESSVAVANSPYVAEISPLPDSSGNSASEPIQAVLFDGQTTVNLSSVQLSLNGAAVVPQTKTQAGGKTVIQYAPNASRTDENNQVVLAYKDSSGASYTNSWRFTIKVSGGSSTVVTGQWDFDAGNLKATVGSDLEYLDGPAGKTATGTGFGTTTSFGIDDIDGKAAKVMKVPGDLDRNIGYVMHHGISPNGGGTRVNQYTLIMDVMIGDTGPGAASMLQISSTNNTDDGDLFWQGNNFGQGTDGYNGTGIFTPGTWHRVVAAYDEAAKVPVVTKYVDGVKQGDWTANQGLDNPRRALLPTAILFGDGDQDERREWYVNSVQIRSGKLSDPEIVVLGGPSADGIPANIPKASVAGQWDFNNGDLAATIGKPLAYLDGPDGVTKNGTLFGITTELGVEDINGEEAKVMKVPGDLDRNIGYVMDHGIAPNGGGTRVNQYTLIMDVLVGDTGPGAASMLQTSSTNNTDDGDLFWQGNNFGQGTDGYVGDGSFTPGTWHRVIAAYDEAAKPPVVTKFVDGVKQDDWKANQGLDNPRRALLPTAVLFGDGDQDERREWWVNSIQIRPGKLTDAEMEALGGPSAQGIPVIIPSTGGGQPTISIARSGNTATLSWPADATGFTLESSDTLPGTTWTPVTGVSNNSVTVTPGPGNRFYRLKK